MKKSQKSNRDDFMLITLCARCVSQFYNSPEHIVHKANPNQKIKELCCYCSCKNGYDYKVKKKVK